MVTSRQLGKFSMLVSIGFVFVVLISTPLLVPHLRQWQANSFEQTPGRVLKITKRQNARGVDVERLDLHYEYRVSGQRYEGTALRYDTFPMILDSEHSTARRYPIGSEVTVFYRPGTPSDALLEPGVDWGKLNTEVLLLLCLQGFVVAFAAIVMDAGLLPPIFLQPIITDRTVSVHSQSEWGTWAMSGLSLSIVSVGGGIIVGLTWSSTTWLAIPVWLSVLIIPVHFYCVYRDCWKRGIYDLTIDFEKGTLTLPGGMLTPQTTLNVADLTKIVVRPAGRPNGPLCTQRLIVARFEYPLLWIGYGAAANEFVDWLSSQLKLPIVIEELPLNRATP